MAGMRFHANDRILEEMKNYHNIINDTGGPNTTDGLEPELIAVGTVILEEMENTKGQ